MRFQINGAVASSGQDVSIRVTATSEAEAAEIAKAKGILVERIESIDAPQPATPLQYATPAKKQPVLTEEDVIEEKTSVPKYHGLEFFAIFMRIGSVIVLIVAIVQIVGCMDSGGRSPGRTPEAMGAEVGYLIGLAITGFGSASAALALRDIARNSFRKNRDGD